MAPVLNLPLNVGQIDDVQELKKSQKTKIPNRFIRDMAERPMLATTPSPLSSSIPVIDLKKLMTGKKEEFQHEILKLSASCEEWGFFQVINHEIELDLLEKIEKVAMEFFLLPVEEKQKYPMAPGTVQGYGQAFVFSEDQKLDWCNMFALGLVPHSIRNPKLWPTNPAMFGQTVETYSREIRKLCEDLLRFIALSLTLNENVFEDMFGLSVQAIRMNYYPACPRPDLVLGLSPHSDGSALTVLQQGKGNTVGLHILKDDTWVPVQPVENALVINIGDTIEVLTNGRYKSLEHRAVTHKEKDRLSIVTFYAPSYDVEIGPMKEMVDESSPSKYKRYNHGEYSRHYVTNKLQGKKTLDFAKILPKKSL